MESRLRSRFPSVFLQLRFAKPCTVWAVQVSEVFLLLVAATNLFWPQVIFPVFTKCDGKFSSRDSLWDSQAVLR